MRCRGLPFAVRDFRFDGVALLLWLSMWTITGGIGISVGCHRHFAHRSFRAHPALRHAMAFCGAMAGQGPAIYWVALHRRHHALSDMPGAPFAEHQRHRHCRRYALVLAGPHALGHSS